MIWRGALRFARFVYQWFSRSVDRSTNPMEDRSTNFSHLHINFYRSTNFVEDRSTNFSRLPINFYRSTNFVEDRSTNFSPLHINLYRRQTSAVDPVDKKIVPFF